MTAFGMHWQILGSLAITKFRSSAKAAALPSLFFVSHAMAQSVGTDQPPPVRSPIDANGINLINGSLYFGQVQIAVGVPGSGGLVRAYLGGLGSGALFSRDNLAGTINSSGSTYTVSVGAWSASFTLSGSTFTSQQGDGSTLTLSGTNYTLVMRDGSTAVFSTTIAGGPGVAANVARITSLTRPNGEVDTYTYTAHSYQIVPPLFFSGFRLDAVTNNFGYEIKYLYLGNGNNNITQFLLSRIIAINNAVDFCAPTATSCSGLTVTWPSITFGTTTPVVTDNLGRATTYPSITASTTTTWVRPSGFTTTYTTDSSSRVITVANGIGTWHYAYSDVGAVRTTTVTDPNGHTRVVVSNTTTLLISSDTNGLSQSTNYLYDGFGRVTKITRPETDFISYTYDARGNIKQVVVTGKDQVSTLTTTADFDATCTLPAKCNRPNWTKDAKGNETDFTYSGSTGQMLTMVRPLGANGVRPETDYSYTSEYAWYKNSSGSIVQAASPISLLTQVSQCATTQTCIGTLHSVQSAYNYGVAGVANNLLPVSLTQGAGDGSLAAVTSFVFDSVGNLYTAKDAGGNFARYRYDTVRQLVGIVGPDPDGAGPLHNRAVRLTYECDTSVKAGCDGFTTLKEQGTVLSQADTDWAAFSTLGKDAIGYDGIDRKLTEIISSAGTYIGATQYSYDTDNRLTCSAVRMNPSAIGSLPASACTLGTPGSAGPDRITAYSYDSADRLLQVTGAYGTSAASNDETDTYGGDGEILTQADGRGDLTTIVRDTFNRVHQVQFPTPSNGLVSSTTDYEQYSYDNNGNITQNRRRDGTLVNYGYDALNLRTSGYNGATYGYDNLERMTSAIVSGISESFGYDGLNRQVSETGPLGTIGRQFDLIGNVTRLTYPDNYYVVYGYDAANEFTGLTDSNSVTLLQQAYNNLGQITSITRASGLSETRGYGSDLRLSSQAYTFPDTSKNVTYSYTYNLAGQPLSMTPNNSLYSTTTSPAATNYASDGQNRYTTVGASTMSYDSRSNLQSDGTNSFAFDGLNRTTTVNSTSFTYDALDRLYATTSGSNSYRALYSGQQIVAAYNQSGTLNNRYVPDLNLDRVILWWPGASTAVNGASWLVTDQFGSVVAGSISGTAAVTTYDAFGITGASGLSPTNGNLGFKGMPSSGSVGIYYARGRTYNANLGRFLQPDPVGYSDGMNYYSFVHNDPIRGQDPMGLSCTISNEITQQGNGGGTEFNDFTVIPTVYRVWYSNDCFGEPHVPGSERGGGSRDPKSPKCIAQKALTGFLGGAVSGAALAISTGQVEGLLPGILVGGVIGGVGNVATTYGGGTAGMVASAAASILGHGNAGYTAENAVAVLGDAFGGGVPSSALGIPAAGAVGSLAGVGTALAGKTFGLGALGTTGAFGASFALGTATTYLLDRFLSPITGCD
jgi:RHS repeat-associated protein